MTRRSRSANPARNRCKTWDRIAAASRDATDRNQLAVNFDRVASGPGSGNSGRGDSNHGGCVGGDDNDALVGIIVDQVGCDRENLAVDGGNRYGITSSATAGNC